MLEDQQCRYQLYARRRWCAQVDNNNKGTSLHNVSDWFGGKEFWIPNGTEYFDEIEIIRDDHQKSNIKGIKKDHHYVLSARTRMTQEQIQGHLDNMAGGALMQQVALVKNWLPTAATSEKINIRNSCQYFGNCWPGGGDTGA